MKQWPLFRGEPALFKHDRHFNCAHTKLRGAAQEVGGDRWKPRMAGIVGKPGDIKRFDCLADASNQIPGFPGGKRFTGQGTDLFDLPRENGISAKQESVGQVGFAQTPGGFRKTGGGEVEQAQSLEQLEPVHCTVKRSHEPGGRLQFERRQLRIIIKTGSERRPLPMQLQQSGYAGYAEKSQREPGRKQRINNASSGGQKRPSPPVDDSTLECEARLVNEGTDGSSRPEHFSQRRQPFEQFLPCQRPRLEILSVCDQVGRGDSGTSDAIIELQHPHPTAGKDMMDRRFFRRIRWRPNTDPK